MFPPPVTTDCAPLSKTKRSLLFRKSLSANLSSSSAKANIYSQLDHNQHISIRSQNTPSLEKVKVRLARQRYKPQESRATIKSSVTMKEFSRTFGDLKTNSSLLIADDRPSFQNSSNNTGGYQAVDPYEQVKANAIKRKEWLASLSKPRMVKASTRRPKLEQILGGDPNSRLTGTSRDKNRPSTSPSELLEERSSMFTNNMSGNSGDQQNRRSRSGR